MKLRRSFCEVGRRRPHITDKIMLIGNGPLYDCFQRTCCSIQNTSNTTTAKCNAVVASFTYSNTIFSFSYAKLRKLVMNELRNPSFAFASNDHSVYTTTEVLSFITTTTTTNVMLYLDCSVQLHRKTR